MGNAFDDFYTVFNGGLLHRDRLETTLKSRIFFDMLAVFRKGGGTDDLNFTTGKSRLEDVGGIHAAFGITCTDNGVNFINDENDVALTADFFNEALHAAFKLTAKLGACHKGCKVQQENLLILQLNGNTALSDALGKPLGNGRFANARLTDETGIVLLAAIENLNDTLQLFLTADHGIELTLGGTGCEVNAVVIQILMFCRAGRILLRF